MRKDTHATILAACRHFLRPLARLLLRHGVGYREFSEVCKSAFVEVASEDYGVRRRPANLSKIAILTGLSRKEAKRIRDSLHSGSDQAELHGLSPASMVLRGWYSDPLYNSEGGKPMSLSSDGRSPNLTSLVKQYAGDIPVKAVITELKRFGAIETLPSGRIRPVGRNFIPANLDGQLFASGARSIHNLIATIANNVVSGSQPQRYFERFTWSNHLPEEAIGALQSLVGERGTAFLEFFESWLTKHEKRKRSSESHQMQNEVGVGIYYFNVSNHKSS